jgi:protein O-GlcNAc transferase
MSLAEALAQHRAGDRVGAERLYRRALVVQPNDAEALHGFGVLCHETGREQEALSLLDRAVKLKPDVAQYAANLGGILSRFGRHQQAIACLQSALKTEPGHPDALRNLALSFMEAGYPALSRAPLLALLGKSSRLGDIWRLLGRAERLAGETLAAAAAYRRACELEPQDFRCWSGWGLALDALGDGVAALGAYERALAIKPDDVETLCHYGIALRRQHRFPEALAAGSRAIALEPNRAESHHLMGTIHQERGDVALAAPFYLKAAELVPNSIETHSNLGLVMARSNRVDLAIASFRKVLELSPGHESATAGLYHALRVACDWQAAQTVEGELAQQTRAALAAQRRPAESPLAQLTREVDGPTRLALCAAWTADIACRAHRPLDRGETARPRDGRLRLAYLSSDFRDHAVGQLSAALFGLHERTRFEITTYSAGPEDASIHRRRIVEGSERFVDVQQLGDRALAEQIARDGIDILVELNGLTSAHRLAALALRPASIQVTWMGFPGSSGASFIDYLIADPVVAPADHQPFFAEQLCRLPHCYLPHDPEEPVAPPVAPGTMTRGQWGLPEKGLVFCSFNTPQKLERATFDIWMRLLGDVPGSVLWLHGGEATAQENLRKAAAASGIEPQRLVFAGRPAKPEHLRRLALADIALDTRSYNGHTTSLDALFAGVPVVAELGSQFASRVAASALNAAGLPGLIARSGAQYAEIALRLAEDPDARQAIRAVLAEAPRKAPLFDAPRFVRNLERGYEIMMARHRRGERPAPIDVREP